VIACLIEERFQLSDRPERARWTVSARERIGAPDLPRVNGFLQLAERGEDEVAPLRRSDGPSIRAGVSRAARLADLELVPAVRALHRRSTTTD
jgi:hypothetical protein